MRDARDSVDDLLSDAPQRSVRDLLSCSSPADIHLEALRRSAEYTMNTLVQTCFSRLHVLDPQEEEEKLKLNQEEAEAEIKMTVATDDMASSTGDDASTSAHEPPLTPGPRVQC